MYLHDGVLDVVDNIISIVLVGIETVVMVTTKLILARHVIVKYIPLCFLVSKS